MKYVYLVLNWTFGVGFLLLGLISLLTSPIGGACLLAMSILLLPPVRSFLFSKTNVAIPGNIRGVLLVVLFLSFGIVVVKEQDAAAEMRAEQEAEEQKQKLAQIRKDNLTYFNENKIDIIERATTAMERDQYEDVIAITTKYIHSTDPDLLDLHSQAQDAITAMQKIEKTQLLLTELKSISASDFAENLTRYDQLVNLHPDNTHFQAKRDHYQSKADEAEQARKAEEKALLAEKARLKRIERQFSGWDGSHSGLERVIKRAMNDPDSYDHAETVYWDKGDHLIVKTTYRGKNAFGGVVKNFVTAKVSLDGQILEIIDQT